MNNKAKKALPTRPGRRSSVTLCQSRPRASGGHAHGTYLLGRRETQTPHRQEDSRSDQKLADPPPPSLQSPCSSASPAPRDGVVDGGGRGGGMAYVRTWLEMFL